MQMAFIAKLVVKPEKVAEFEKIQQQLSDITHDTEPDTLVYDFIKHREQANTYVVYSRFKDEPHSRNIKTRRPTRTWYHHFSRRWPRKWICSSTT